MNQPEVVRIWLYEEPEYVEVDPEFHLTWNLPVAARSGGLTGSRFGDLNDDDYGLFALHELHRSHATPDELYH